MIDPERSILFVGGVPAPTSEDVFRLCGGGAGARALALPDGEIGPRSMWIASLGALTWSRHPDLEQLPPDPDHPLHHGGHYRVKIDPAQLSLVGYLPYAQAAIESYTSFRRLRDEGVVAEGVRFQVSVPTAHAAVYPYFHDASVWPAMWNAWANALRSEFEAILERVPADDLVVQLDYCTELEEMHGDLDIRADWIPAASEEERFATYTSPDYLTPMTGYLPDDVLLGYHICAGTYPTQPVSNLADISLPVRLANALIANTPRRVDYFHLPVMRETSDAFFAPLRDLRIGDAHVYLGIECDDGADAMYERIALARRHLPSFGVAHYCGYRADKEPRMRELVGQLVAGAAAAGGPDRDRSSAPPGGRTPSK